MFGVGVIRIDGIEIVFVAVGVNALYAKHYKVRLFLFGGFKEFRDGVFGNCVVRVNKPKIFTLSVSGAVVARRRRASSYTAKCLNLGMLLGVLFDNISGIISRIIIDDENFAVNFTERS